MTTTKTGGSKLIQSGFFTPTSETSGLARGASGLAIRSATKAPRKETHMQMAPLKKPINAKRARRTTARIQMNIVAKIRLLQKKARTKMKEKELAMEGWV